MWLKQSLIFTVSQAHMLGPRLITNWFSICIYFSLKEADYPKEGLLVPKRGCQSQGGVSSPIKGLKVQKGGCQSEKGIATPKWRLIVLNEGESTRGTKSSSNTKLHKLLIVKQQVLGLTHVPHLYHFMCARWRAKVRVEHQREHFIRWIEFIGNWEITGVP